MKLFHYRNIDFEDHGRECKCTSCRWTYWDGIHRALVLAIPREGYDGEWQIYGDTITREMAAEILIARYPGIKSHLSEIIDR